MREIKFRAWDGKCNRWWTHEETLSLLMLSGRVADGTADDRGHLDRYSIEQFTGLKDKDGTDIYVGDILNMDGHYYLEDDNDWYPRVMTGKVVFLPSKGTCLRSPAWVDCLESDMKGKLYYDMPISAYKCTIIGNIHENPELLSK